MQDLGPAKLSSVRDACIDFTVAPAFETNSRDTGEDITVCYSQVTF